MVYANVLASFDQSDDLRKFATAFFSAIGASAFERRESSGYASGFYFRARHDGLNFNVSLSDEEGFEKFPFWIQVSSETSTQDELGAAVRSLLDSPALQKGFHFALVQNFGKRDAKIIFQR